MAPEILTQMILNYVVDYLMPVEYDGSAYIAPEHVNKPSLRINRLLSWEKDQAAGGVEVALAPVASFFAKVKTRDKAGRLVQYLCRMLHGILERSGNHAALQSILNKLILTVSNARRTFRVLEVGPLLTLARGVSSAGEVVAFPRQALAATVFQAAFNLTDRLRWLQEHRLARGDFRATGRMAMRLLCACHLVQSIRHLLRAARIHARDATSRTRGNGTALSARHGELRERLHDACKQFLCFLQAGHMGKVPYVQTNNAVVGLMGVLTSSSDLWELWCKAR